ALASAGLADAYTLLGMYGVLSPRDALPHARAAARRSVELGPELAEAHNAVAGVRLWDWDWAGADREFRKALELNPGYVQARCWHGMFNLRWVHARAGAGTPGGRGAKRSSIGTPASRTVRGRSVMSSSVGPSANTSSARPWPCCPLRWEREMRPWRCCTRRATSTTPSSYSRSTASPPRRGSAKILGLRRSGSGWAYPRRPNVGSVITKQSAPDDSRIRRAPAPLADVSPYCTVT